MSAKRSPIDTWDLIDDLVKLHIRGEKRASDLADAERALARLRDRCRAEATADDHEWARLAEALEPAFERHNTRHIDFPIGHERFVVYLDEFGLHVARMGWHGELEVEEPTEDRIDVTELARQNAIRDARTGNLKFRPIPDDDHLDDLDDFPSRVRNGHVPAAHAAVDGREVS